MSYQNGDLDIIKLAGDQVDQVKDDSEFLTVGAGYLWYISPMMQKVPELANLNLRMALTHALNRQQIVDDVVKDGSLATYTAVPSQYAFSDSGEDFTLIQKEFPEYSMTTQKRPLPITTQLKQNLAKIHLSLR